MHQLLHHGINLLVGQRTLLILVDGVPRDANNVLPTEIQQITFLKSASAVALYGSRAAKGAVLITTKRGQTDGLHVSVRGNAGMFTPKEYPTYLGAAQYMSLYNEALTNDGKSPVYSETDIYNYASGRNSYRYPSIDFFSKDYLRKAYTRYDGNAEFEGGGKYAHFYANIGLYHVGDLVKFGEGKHNHTNRLNVRGNIDLRLNDWITGWVDANATFYDQRGDRSNYWAQSATLRPTTQYPLTPLVPIDMMNPDVLEMQKMIANSNYVVDGKYLLRGKGVWWLLPAFAAVILDGIVGVLKFKQKAEQIDIVEGIRRIRDGEVDYKLDVEALHGDNREMTDGLMPP